MRLCFDLDGTLCQKKLANQDYGDLHPTDGAREALQQLKAAGHYIIIYTARNMKTCNNQLGLIVARQVPVIIEWLKKHNIPYDEIWPCKPLADFYIDDRCIPYNNNWIEITERLTK